MSFTKSHTLPSGATVSVYRIQASRIDYNARESSTILSAYVDGAQQVPLVPVFAKLRLTGDKFEAILGKTALAASKDDVNGVLYSACRTEPVICDAGADFFTDALET